MSTFDSFWFTNMCSFCTHIRLFMIHVLFWFDSLIFIVRFPNVYDLVHFCSTQKRPNCCSRFGLWYCLKSNKQNRTVITHTFKGMGKNMKIFREWPMIVLHAFAPTPARLYPIRIIYILFIIFYIT